MWKENRKMMYLNLQDVESVFIMGIYEVGKEVVIFVQTVFEDRKGFEKQMWRRVVRAGILGGGNYKR